MYIRPLPYLHVSILDSIVDHLDVVTSSVLPNPVTAWLLADLSGDPLEDGLDVFPSLRVSPRHEGGAVASTVLSPAHPAANKEQTLLSKGLSTTLYM